MNLHRQSVLTSMAIGLTGVLLCATCGCSTFNRAWREAEHQPAGAHSLAGRWEGRWLSEVNGHRGKLRCVISHRADGECAAWFRASYLTVLRFGYTVKLRVEHRDGAWHFVGEEDLGKLAGGVYRYAGWATHTEFHATYDSASDRGTFEMRRPGGEAIVSER
ncbi:MAG TPA: hypothetical protein VI136_01805 [Verrucomicrobiae bacterium]